jgi:hypothetical protein
MNIYTHLIIITYWGDVMYNYTRFHQPFITFTFVLVVLINTIVFTAVHTLQLGLKSEVLDSNMA